MMVLSDGTDEFARGELVETISTGEGQFLPKVRVTLYYFKEIKLIPKVVFLHLSGAPLKKWLDFSFFTDARLVEQAEQDKLRAVLWTGPLRYIHGRSETMKGKHTVSAIVLARVQGEVDETTWLTTIPGVYKEFTRLLNTQPNKSP